MKAYCVPLHESYCLYAHDVEPVVLTYVDDPLIVTSKFQLFYWHGWK